MIVDADDDARGADLRYDDWEYTRRRRVEEAGQGRDRLRAPAGDGRRRLRAVGAGLLPGLPAPGPDHRRAPQPAAATSTAGSSASCCARRGSTGSTAWAIPYWNMQYAFRGHIVVLWTSAPRPTARRSPRASGGSGLGKVIGTRTWGGEIWLSREQRPGRQRHRHRGRDRRLRPRGQVAHRGPRRRSRHRRRQPAARRPSTGKDAQLDAAIRYLQERIQAEPIKDVPPPAFPRRP